MARATKMERLEAVAAVAKSKGERIDALRGELETAAASLAVANGERAAAEKKVREARREISRINSEIAKVATE